jgi:hypothetical protein
MPKLIHKGTGQEYLLAEGVTRLGRMPSNTIQVLGKMVSRSHCRVEGPKGGWILTDSGSKLGTFVNGELMMRPHLLRSGDEIRVGSVFYVFQDDQRSPHAPPAVHPLSDDAAAKLLPSEPVGRRWGVLPVAIGGLVAVLAIGGLATVLLLTRETPRKMLLRAVDLLGRKDARGLWDMVSSEAQLRITFDEFESSVKAVPPETAEALRHVEIGRERRTDRGLVVPVALRAGGQRLEDEVVLFREDGRWRFQSVPTQRLAERAPK